jgi:hypothetical protein
MKRVTPPILIITAQAAPRSRPPKPPRTSADFDECHSARINVTSNPAHAPGELSITAGAHEQLRADRIRAGPPRGDRSRPSSSGWQRGRCVRPAPKKVQASTRPVSCALDTPFRTHDVAMPVRLHAKRFRKCVDTGQSRHEEAKGTSGRCWRATSKNKRLPLFAVRCGPHGSAASSVTPYHRESPPHPRH